MISAIFFLFFVPSLVLSQPILTFQKFDLPSTSVGPFSIAFDRFGKGPFTGISDGRIVRYDTLQKRFIDFAFTGPNRYDTLQNQFIDFAFTGPDRTKAMCDGTDNNNDPIMGATCGRPLGLAFYFGTNQMYVTDAYKGLLLVEPIGGLAANIATGAEGVPFKFLFHLDVDQATGDVYFTEFSTRYNISQLPAAIDAGDSTGRLLKYTRRTGEVSVLLSNLSGAAGVAISHDKTYLLVAESIANKVKKFWLSGPYAFTARDLVTFEGRPLNIKRNVLLDYWVAVSTRIPTTNGTIFRVPSAVRIRGDGMIEQTVDLGRYYPNTTVSEFQPTLGIGSAYIGSLRASSLGRIN